MQSFAQIKSMASNFFSAYASAAAFMMLFRSVAKDIIPEPVKSFLLSAFNRFLKRFFGSFFTKLSTHTTMVVDEQTGMKRNQIYDAAQIYLGTRINPDSERVKVSKSSKQKSIILSMVKEQKVVDSFQGFELQWQFVLVESQGGKGGRFRPDKRYFELTFEKQNGDKVVHEYLPYVISKAKELKDNERAVKLYTRDCPFKNNDDEGEIDRGRGHWGCIDLDHPATFDKLAMDPDLKRAIVEDLDRFVRRKEYYKKVGKAWKRGYLLYGPPGTGKSSLVAAIANYLRFDVYDLELSGVHSNSKLRRILLSTNNKSIIVVEDIDCSTQMHNRNRKSKHDSEKPTNAKLTLSGLLNFIDGLWSTCGDERIIIFTTNHKEKLDPALLRPGRMDMHIHMGYCTPEGFDVLAFNYLRVNDHPRLFPEIKQLIREVEITPAEIAEHLMRSEDVDRALEGVIDLLKQKKEKKGEMVKGSDDKENEGDGDKGAADQGKEGKKGKFGKIVKILTKLGRQSSKEVKAE